ncbi:MAG: J domain-containing protein, partial [Thermoguttaceae bacterium]
KMFQMGGMGGGRGMGGGNSSDDFFGGETRREPTRGADLDRTLSIPFVLAVEGGTIDMSFRRPGGKEETISVKIPAGIEEGKKIRLAGLGQPGHNGGKAGNLMVTVRIDEHPCFTRRDNNLYLRLPITLQEAVFGGKVEVPTPKGRVQLSIPSGSTSGTKLRIRGHGIVPSKSKGHDETPGDVFVELVVMLPQKWTSEDKELLSKLVSKSAASFRDEIKWS